ncbi:MAG: CRISPR-associated endoribonuclease Cas6 [Euryarchaeota archaeon]|nr:CRISPR-associated endoribonuclease Cas6 [Euryarchaeota archaeon]
MRVKLVFHHDGKNPIPFNRKRAIQAWLYRCIRSFNEEYSKKLHFDRDIKLFVFSDLIIPNYRWSRKGLFTKENLSLMLSSPRSEFISNLVKGLLNNVDENILTLKDVALRIKSIETLPSKKFGSTAEFRTLSPITTSTHKNGKIYYIPPHKKQFYENLKNNLRKKYPMVTGKQCGKPIKIDLIWTKCPKKPQNSIRVKKGHVVCFDVPLKIEATPKLLETVYECGIGEKNSMGFGMVEVYT